MRHLTAILVSVLLLVGCGDDTPAPPRSTEPIDAGLAEVPPDDAVDAPVSDVAEDTEDFDVSADAADAEHDTTPAPLEATLTLNELPPEMNGSSGAFTLTLPTEGFTIDITVTGGAGVSAEGVAITLDSAPLATPAQLDAERFQLRVPAEDGLVSGADNALCGTVTDLAGTTVALECLRFDLAVRTPALDPFPQPETWLVMVSRDQFTPDPDTSRSPPRLYSADGGDGVPDLDQALDSLGLTSAGQNPELDALTRARLLARVRALVEGIYLKDTPDPVRVNIVFEGDPGAPDPSDFAPDGAFSMIALGGDVPRRRQDESFVGRAEIDWNNQVRNDDTQLDLGVFVSSIARQAIAHPAGYLILGKSCPLLGGTPFGANAMDAVILADGAERAGTGDLQIRQDYYNILLDLLSLALGATLAHEMGHSLGLVPPGLPPEGLFAGLAELPFPGSTIDDAHIDTPGLNVMQTGAVTDYFEAIQDRKVSFNPLNRAWLRRQLLVIRP